MMMKRVLVAVATFERQQLLEHTLRSLAKARLPQALEVHLFDDASTMLPWPAIRDRYPFISAVHIADRNLGADHNLMRILELFSRSDFSHLLILDSDSLVRDDLFEYVQQLEDDPHVIFTAYRSTYHSEKPKRREAFVEKVSIGALGMILSQDNVRAFLSRVEHPQSIDWQIVTILRRKGARFLAPKRSLIEHIGWHGTHNKISSFDRAIEFEPTNAEDRAVLLELRSQVDSNQTPLGLLIHLYKTKVNSLVRHRISAVLRRLTRH